MLRAVVSRTPGCSGHVIPLDPGSQARILERGKTSGRADDNPEAIRKRLATFKEVPWGGGKGLDPEARKRQLPCPGGVQSQCGNT